MKITALILVVITLAAIVVLLVSVFPYFKAVSDLPQPQWSISYTRVPTYVITGSVASAQDEGNAVVQTTDGGYAIAGFWHDHGYAPHSGGVDNYTGVIMKTDSSGRVQWEKTWNTGYSGINHRSIIQTSDSGFLFSNGNWLIKLDAEGTVEWSKNFDCYFRDVLQASDGDYVMAGEVMNKLMSGPDAFLLKTDEEGNQLWSRTFSVAPAWSRVDAVVETGYGGFAITGERGYAWFALTDSEGNLKLSQNFSELDGWFSSIVRTRDGGFVLAGGTYLGGLDDQGLGLLAKVNSQGEMEWHQTYNLPPWEQRRAFKSVAQIGDGGYLAVGKVTLVKTDASGNVQWHLYDFDADFEDAASVISTGDRGFAVVGSLNGNVWLTKFASELAVPGGWISSVWVIAVVAAVIVAGTVDVGLLFYFKKRTLSPEC